MLLLSKPLAQELKRVSQSLPDFGRNIEAPHLLTYDDVLEAHFCIADYFMEQDYGIGGIGPKSVNGLVSTVERQWMGFQGVTVYKSEYERIASLLYGLIKNHPFHDANKRTAFLCALLQLHRMGRTITVGQKDFEDLMVSIADNSIKSKAAVRKMDKQGHPRPEIAYLGRYLEKNSRRSARLSRTIKFRELRYIISKHGFDFDNPFKGSIDIVVREEKTVRGFFRTTVVKNKRKVGAIAYHGEGVDVPDNTLKHVRQICGLTDQDGFDGEVLLRDAQPTFQLINSYREALQRLAYR
ncbi:death-on-curing protein [Limimaricola soesokkakensis]|uniref:Death-on-curing protein n=1 Tax=Limimaricola soesokkakensis TaxID=1343159 RepID=A0A1X6YC13_9RHOB|nr:type II toxin-antitoxin system death-on-curing family toxin [Limimaricola soesokkakensis]PSK87185.1 death-on-curing protein [Limimaricola soesokkakensis]SLN15002.1 Fic/DOC family protein [Limimaricola soesokkakensis]